MPEYQLQIKQVVDYPRCRIYREFIHKLINDRSIRINGGSGLFHFTVLCSYANFRTSYRRIDGISYTVSPGEWVCTVKELSCWFRTRFHRQALSMLDTLQKQHLISYTLLGRGNVVKYKILHWARHNSALEYNAPCQKDTGFFFLPVSVALELVSSARCSEMDIVLDLWVSAVYNDTQVQGSEVGPVAYFRNGTGNPLVSYTELSCRWGLSRATVCRILKKLDGLGYISIMSFPGRHGSVIYLQNYLSTMFEISDVLIDKEEVAMTLNIHLELPETAETEESHSISEHEVIVSDALSSVSKSHIERRLAFMGILDGIVEWIAEQVMAGLDLVTTSVLGALGCDMAVFLRYFPAAETMYSVFVALAIGIILLNWVWQLFKNFGLGAGVEAEDPVKLSIRSVIFILLTLFSDEIVNIVLTIGGTPYHWIMESDLPALSFADFNSVMLVIIGVCANGAVALITLILVLILAWNYLKLLFEAAERYVLLGVLVYTAPVAFSMGASQTTANIWKSWCRMLGGQIFLLVMNAWCLRLFTSMVGSFLANPLSL